MILIFSVKSRITTIVVQGSPPPRPPHLKSKAPDIGQATWAVSRRVCPLFLREVLVVSVLKAIAELGGRELDSCHADGLGLIGYKLVDCAEVVVERGLESRAHFGQVELALATEATRGRPYCIDRRPLSPEQEVDPKTRRLYMGKETDEADDSCKAGY